MKRYGSLLLFVALMGGCTLLAGLDDDYVLGVCTPGETQACYSGPEGTENVGLCSAGLQTCSARGEWDEPCVGEVVPKSKVCAAQNDADCDGKLDCEGPHVWSKHFDGGSQEDGCSVATDTKGNTLVTGSFGGTIDFGGGPLTTAGSNDIFVAKFGPYSNHIWSKSFGDDKNQRRASIATDNEGNVVLTGNFNGTIDFDFGNHPLINFGGTDIFVAKLNQDGQHMWSKSFSNDGTKDKAGIATDAKGNIVLTGSIEGTVNFGGGDLSSPVGSDIFVAKFDKDGLHRWSRRFGDTDDQEGTSVATDSAGDVLVTGYFAGTVDFGGGPLTCSSTSSSADKKIFAVKLGADDGHHIWSKCFGHATTAIAPNAAIATDTMDNVMLIGDFEGTIKFGGDQLTSSTDKIFVAKFEKDGTYAWSKLLGDPDFLSPLYIAADSAGNVVVTGGFKGSIDLGEGPLSSAGGDMGAPTSSWPSSTPPANSFGASTSAITAPRWRAV